jgi:hypothetical protein
MVPNARAGGFIYLNLNSQNSIFDPDGQLLEYSISKIVRTKKFDSYNYVTRDFPGWLVLNNGILEGVPPLSEYLVDYEVYIKVSDGFDYMEDKLIFKILKRI